MPVSDLSQKSRSSDRVERVKVFPSSSLQIPEYDCFFPNPLDSSTDHQNNGHYISELITAFFK
jgi:hypothetical protein